jgi:hypothetical protein
MEEVSDHPVGEFRAKPYYHSLGDHLEFYSFDPIPVDADIFHRTGVFRSIKDNRIVEIQL